MMQGKNLCFSYSREQEFIKELSVSLPESRITTIIGPNGSGKSTLLNLLIRVLKPQQGQILIGKVDINRLRYREIARRMATVYQHHTSPQDITVKEIIYFGRTPHKGYFEMANAQDEEIVNWAIQATNLTELQEKRVGCLSGGETQRTWIAMALAQKPKILFLDEPTTYLDMFHQIEILELIKGLNREQQLTVVMVLHDLNHAIKYSDHIVVMKKGEIIGAGAPGETIDEKLIEKTYKVRGIMHTSDNRPFFIPVEICRV